ncbi:hypothetical protein GCM10010182_33790 [Actinomadura cremea]|nr:hypothetical protein GCM10010182_33790 [Actinomadura cremea]
MRAAWALVRWGGAAGVRRSRAFWPRGGSRGAIRARTGRFSAAPWTVCGRVEWLGVLGAARDRACGVVRARAGGWGVREACGDGLGVAWVCCAGGVGRTGRGLVVLVERSAEDPDVPGPRFGSRGRSRGLGWGQGVRGRAEGVGFVRRCTG